MNSSGLGGFWAVFGFTLVIHKMYKTCLPAYFLCRVRKQSESASYEMSVKKANENEVELAVRRILLIHGFILTAGRIPLIYLGDEIGTLI